MNKESIQSACKIRSAEIEQLINEFGERFNAGTENEDNFMTIHQLEEMWQELQCNTQNIYSDMIRNFLTFVDEKGLIRKKKDNMPQKE